MIKFLFIALLLICTHGIAQEPTINCSKNDKTLAFILESLVPVGRIHNCQIEVLKTESDNSINYGFYGWDLFQCRKITGRPCPEVLYEFSISKDCKLSSSGLQDIRHSIGYNLDNRSIRSFIDLKFSFNQKLLRLQIGQVNMQNSQRIAYLDCKPELFTELE